MIIRQPGISGNFSDPRAPAHNEATTERHGIVGRQPGTCRTRTGDAGLPDDHENGWLQ